MKKCHLKLDLLHPDFIKKGSVNLKQDHGITYQLSTPQTLFDSVWFWNCRNVPEDLPPYLSVLTMNPMKAIGHGLSEEDAVSIVLCGGTASPTDLFRAALMAGWEVWPTSCACGGQWAWVKPTGRGSMEMFGCICHYLPEL